MKEMHVNEVYKRFMAERVHVRHTRIKSVRFTHHVNDRPRDPDEFDTFAGCEMWNGHVELTNGEHRSVNFWDMCPAGSIAHWAEEHSIKITFDEDKPPTPEELVEMDMRGRC